MGTTLEILAPYLPYGISLMTPKGEAKLLGLNSGFFQCPVETELLAPEPPTESLLSGRYNWDYEDVTLLLRPFRSLTTKLADGTVAAVEVAKLLLASVTDALDWNNATTNEDEDRIEVQVPVRGQYPWLLHIQSDATITCYNNVGIEKEVVGLTAYDYLRRNLFALPIGGQPLQEGTDYIAKED